MPESIPMPSTGATSDQKKFPSEIIGLPSEGHFYPENHPLASGKIEIKYMTAKEEDILTSQNLIKKGVVLDELLKALIVTPVPLDDVLLTDKNAIYMAARRLAYGDKYSGTVTCNGCGKEVASEIDLAALTTKPFDFSKYQKGQNTFEFTLPASKVKVTYKLLTHRDNKDIDAELENLKKIVKSGAALPEMTTRLKYTIIALDGKPNKAAIRSFVDTMLSRDSMALRNHIRDNTPELDLTFEFKCPECGHTERMALPLGVDFFWPTS